MVTPYRASRPHSLDTPHSVGLLWTSDLPDPGTYTWQNTTLTSDRYPCFQRRYSNPQMQQAIGRRLTLLTGRPLGPFNALHNCVYCIEYLRMLHSIYLVFRSSTIYSALNGPYITESLTLIITFNTSNSIVTQYRKPATCFNQLRGHPQAVKIHKNWNYNCHWPHGRYNCSSIHNTQRSTHLITLKKCYFYREIKKGNSN